MRHDGYSFQSDQDLPTNWDVAKTCRESFVPSIVEAETLFIQHTSQVKRRLWGCMHLWSQHSNITKQAFVDRAAEPKSHGGEGKRWRKGRRVTLKRRLWAGVGSGVVGGSGGLWGREWRLDLRGEVEVRGTKSAYRSLNKVAKLASVLVETWGRGLNVGLWGEAEAGGRGGGGGGWRKGGGGI